MSIIVGILMAVRSFTVLAGFVSGDPSPVEMSKPVLGVHKPVVTISTSIKNGIPEELEKLIQAGTSIPLFLVVDTEDRSANTTVASVTYTKLIEYSPVSNTYSVTNLPGMNQAHFSGIDSAITSFTTFVNMPICSLSHLAGNSFYVVKMQSLLGSTSIDALGGKAFDLMYYWDYKRPSLRTEPIKGAIFINGAK